MLEKQIRIHCLALTAYRYLRESQNFVSYSDVRAHLECSFQELSRDILPLVMRECHDRKEPFLPALIINRNGVPSAGFFQQVRGFGYKFDLEHKFWEEHLEQIRSLPSVPQYTFKEWNVNATGTISDRPLCICQVS